MQIEFKNGIPGFEDEKTFILNDIKDHPGFKSMISTKNDYIGFITVSPFEIRENYEFNINDEIIEKLEIEKPEDVFVLSMVRVGEYIKDSTVNLQAPIIINTKNNKATQYIIQNSKYSTREPIKC
ncbi:MAG: flagellar assembly protein FliW [Peptostreptococcaceae bacterium]